MAFVAASEIMKKNVAKAASELIEKGMLVGLGSGSTTAYFIDFLGQRCRQGLKIRAVASSLKSLNQANELGIPTLDINDVTEVDLTIDGADEIDPLKQMIKGGGGAHVREKILASMSREMVVIVDETKLVEKLGKHPLPIEVIPFAKTATAHKIQKLGYKGAWRKNTEDRLFITDNGNHIFDISFPHPLDHPYQVHEALIHLPGVVDTGFFFHLAGRVLIGFKDGQVVVKD